MAVRSQILAGKAVIVIEAQDLVDKALRNIQRKMQAFSARMNRLGQDALRLGIAGAIPTAFIAKQFVSFEDALLKVEARLQTTPQKFAKLTDTIRELGRTTSFTATEVAGAAGELAKAGFSSDEVSDSLAATLDLARAGELSLGQAGTVYRGCLSSRLGG